MSKNSRDILLSFSETRPVELIPLKYLATIIYLDNRIEIFNQIVFAVRFLSIFRVK